MTGVRSVYVPRVVQAAAVGSAARLARQTGRRSLLADETALRLLGCIREQGVENHFQPLSGRTQGPDASASHPVFFPPAWADSG